MLVLTRQKDQRIVIEVGGTRLELTIVDLRPDKVRLGFDGPDSVKVFRSELYEQIAKENQQAAQVTPGQLSMCIVPSARPLGRRPADPDRN